MSVCATDPTALLKCMKLLKLPSSALLLPNGNLASGINTTRGNEDVSHFLRMGGLTFTLNNFHIGRTPTDLVEKAPIYLYLVIKAHVKVRKQLQRVTLKAQVVKKR